MNTIEQIVKNESLDVVVTVFSLFKAPPRLGMMIRRYKSEVLQYGELESAYTRLIEAGVPVSGEKGLAVKGAQLESPLFVIEKRYIE